MRRSTVYLIVYLAVLFNLERLDFGQVNFFDISSMLYLEVTLAVALIILSPRIGRLKLSFLVPAAIAIYTLLRLLLVSFQDRPLFGDIYTYITIAEYSLLVIGILLAHHVADHLNDFEEAVYNITLEDISHRVHHVTDAQEDIQREITRSRRHNYPLSLLFIEPDSRSVDVTLNHSVLEIQKKMMTRYVLTSLMRIVVNMTRRTDLIIDKAVDSDSFVVMVTDTNSEQTVQLAERLRQAIRKKLGVQVCCGLATFPDEAITFDELVQRAYLKIQCEKDLAAVEQRAPEIAF
ncbi:MAG: hypothetical protein ACKOC5_11975 [Chloroflexota bacterium]